MDQNLKPNTEASYDYHTGPNGEEQYIRGSIIEHSLHFPQDTFEIFPFIIEGQSLALGAQVNVGGAFFTLQQIDLDLNPYSFGPTHKGHSGQFRSTNMKRAFFWNTLLDKMGLLP